MIFKKNWIQKALFGALAMACWSGGSLSAKNLNVAKPSEHPYVQPEGSREGHRLTEEEVNRYRVYDFYLRQAEYYMSQEKVPNVIPAYPGLDAGEHGHWGKYNQNGHKDGRWNDMQHDGVIGAHLHFNKKSGIAAMEGGMILELDPKRGLYGVFSPRDMNVVMYYKGGKPTLDPFRWGTSRGMGVSSLPLWKTKSQSNQDIEYKGYYDYEGQGVFSYVLNGVEYLDQSSVTRGQEVFVRTLQLQSEAKGALFNVGASMGKAKFEKRGPLSFKMGDVTCQVKLIGAIKAELMTKEDGLYLNVSEAAKGSRFRVYVSDLNSGELEGLVSDDYQDSNLEALTHGGIPHLKNYQHTTKVTHSNEKKAYVIDDFELPFENDQNSLMFLSGIDFDAKGHAYVCTLMGEVWKVSGLAKGSQIQWKKVASGLNQPFGLRIWDGKMHLLERTRIVVLHDLNGDDQIDYYENYNNQIPVRAKSHTHKFGLERDSKGDIYFINDTTICRVRSADKQFEIISTGVRNCMGVGSTLDGGMLFGPQEGTNTPTTAIIEFQNVGEFYGHKGEVGQNTVDAPMCYIPRGVDGSVGGFYQVNDERWGPLGKSILGLSYGYGQWYQVLRKKTSMRTQGATIPMPGEFFAGVVRAATNPVDGQVYTVGLDGWGDYSAKDGCLHRIRYTGEKLYQPIGYEVYDNGLQLDFSVELDGASVERVKNYFAQMWDYLNSKAYGSPEYSHLNPEQLGHDRIAVTSAHLLNQGKSIFVEMPELKPVMQMHLHLNLKAADGHEVKTDIFPTLIELGPYKNLPGLQARVADKNRDFHLRYKTPVPTLKETVSGVKDDHARPVKIAAIAGMKYDKSVLKVKAGESIKIVFENKDGMPHNFVIAKPGQYEAVGLASFKMLNDPKAGDKHYVPDMSEVLAYTYVVQPKGKHTTYVKIPEEKGEYMFLCTFPGHWQLMKGKFIVE